jgi:hypothetical protein
VLALGHWVLGRNDRRRVSAGVCYHPDKGTRLRVNTFFPRVVGGQTWACYRISTITPEGHIRIPPRVVEAKFDEEAIKQARPFLGKSDIEIWCGARLVRRFDPDHRAIAV